MQNKLFDYDIVVFCHLRWDFVYQRPQHIISRMAQGLKVLFIEEPLPHETDRNSLSKLIPINENLHILQCHVQTIADVASVLPEYVNKKISTGWFYSASFIPLLEYFDFKHIVYDCMDELSLFKGASVELVNQEKALVSQADVVFTGGKSLYESKRSLHNNVHCFPSSIDREHFAQALSSSTIVPEDIKSIPSPIVGYYGVIDERVDLALIQETAILNPDVSFVMIGPLAKISAEDLPKQSNIHFLGMKSYEELPAYLKAFDVAMMPFALNEATKYISPTKTLEYMAANKPVISTAIHDVVRDYQHCVTIIHSAQEFSDAIQVSLKQSHIISKYDEILNQTSWDKTVSDMKKLIHKK